MKSRWADSGSPLDALQNIVTHLDVLLTDAQKQRINWHAEQSVQLAVMRALSEWGEVEEAQEALRALSAKWRDKWDAMTDMSAPTAQALYQCATDLDAVLARLTAAPEAQSEGKQ